VLVKVAISPVIEGAVEAMEEAAGLGAAGLEGVLDVEVPVEHAASAAASTSAETAADAARDLMELP
jgi:hypothetical protein